MHLNRHEPAKFELFDLQNVEECFKLIDLVSYQEKKTLREGNTEVVINAVPSGSSIGGSAWHIIYNNLNIIYAMDVFDRETPISIPMEPKNFKGANLMITNSYILPELYG